MSGAGMVKRSRPTIDNQGTMPLLIRLALNVQEPSGLTRIARLDEHLYELFQLYTISNTISINLTYHV